MIFVVLSVLIYGVLFKISEWISGIVGIPYIVTVPVISIFLLVVIYFMNKAGALKRNKIGFFSNNLQCLWVSAPLLVIPAMNNYLTNCTSFAIITEVREIPLILYCGISALSEELLFRAILPNLLSERYQFSLFQSTVIVNVLFALMHLGNVLEGATMEFVVIQSVLAMSIGLCLSGIIEITKSIFTSACMHWLINLSSLHCDSYMSALSLKELLIWVGLSILGVIYGLMLIRSNEEVA